MHFLLIIPYFCQEAQDPFDISYNINVGQVEKGEIHQSIQWKNWKTSKVLYRGYCH